jgi:hypothetical protein
MRTTTALRQLPTTVVALLAALALAVAAALLTGAGLTASDSAGATWNKKSDFAGATGTGTSSERWRCATCSRAWSG